MSAIPATTGSVLITFEYNPDATEDGAAAGLGWVIIHDNPVLAWLVDDTGAGPVVPVILGSMPALPPSTDPILSPAWGVLEGQTVYIPDMARGSATDMFNFLSSNNDVKRPLYAKFANYDLAIAWNQWSGGNPLALTAPPNVETPDAMRAREAKEEEARKERERVPA